MSIIGNPLIIGDSGGGGGGGSVIIVDTPDVHGGTIREIIAVENIQSMQTETVSSSGTSYVTPSSGYDAMTRVQLTVPEQTLPTSASASATTGYTSKATIARSTSDQYINIPTGFNDAGAYYKVNAVANGSAAGPSSISASSATVSTGTNTLTLTKTGVSTTPTVSEGYVSSATSSTATVALTASVTTKGATTYTPTTSNQTISSGTYLTGTHTILGDANLTAENIKKDVSIFNITGEYEGGIPVNVEANKTMYVGGGTTEITPSSGYDAMAKVTTVVQSGTLATPTINSSTGVVTAQVSTHGYIESGASTAKTLQLPTQAAQTIYPSTSDQSIASGAYLTGAQTIKGVLLTNLTADNIKQGVVVKVGDSADDDRITAITGTYAGGGGMGTLLGTLSVGTISTSSTSATDTGKSITVKGIYDYDLLICECSVNTKTNGRHACTSRLCWLTAGTTIGTKSGATFATATWNVKLSSSGTATSRSNTTPYGVYANAATVSAGSTGDNGQAVISIYQRYNNTQTGTINGTYTMRVYGINLYDLIGG